MRNRPHGLKPILHLCLVLGLTAVAPGAQPTPGSAVIARDQGAIVGPPTEPFNMPTDVAVGPDGVAYVLDGVNQRVVAYDPEGHLQFQFGSRGSAPGQFLHPLGIATDPNGNIYVADSGNHRFQVFTAEGRLRDAVPLPVATSGPLPDPADVGVDPVRKRLYIPDNDNHCIHVYNLADGRFEAVWGGPGQGERQFRFPFLVATSAQGYLLVVEPINTRVQVLNAEGKFVGFIGNWGIEAGQLFRPKGVALWRNRVFVTDSYLGNIQTFDLNGRFLGTLTDIAGSPMNFTTPTGIAVDASRNRLFVVELKANRVRRLDLELGSKQPQAQTRPLGPIHLPSPLSKPSLPSGRLPGNETFPNSSRECAICHVRWVQVFGRNQSSDGPMRDVLERKAGSGDMCLSCHDGSVADSRFKVWSTRHHTTDAVPPPSVHIPTEVFPLDAQGRMTCATCHTAHAVPGDSDLRTVVFLRRPNVDSSLCLSCHPEHAQKSERHHPLGHRDSPIPQAILDAGGKTSADGHSILCQTCHEPHGARNAWMLVLPPSELCVACHTDKAPEAAPPAGAPVHRIGRTYTGFKPPQTLLDKKATFGPHGELTCLSCHRLHDASGVRPLLIQKNEDSSLCLGCHEKEKAVLGSPHDLRLSSPETVNAKGQNAAASGPCGACHRIHGWAREVPDTNRPHSSGCMECHKTPGPGSDHRSYVEAHPVGVTVPQDMAPPLPLDSASRAIGCLTCHDPHVPRPSEGLGNQESGTRDTKPDAKAPTPELSPGAAANVFPSAASDFQFLRRPGSELCVLCHDKLAGSLQGPHDPGQFPPSLRETLGTPSSAGSCRVCHTAHNARGPHLWARAPAESAAGPLSNLCDACHNGDIVEEPPQTHHPLAVIPDAEPQPGPAAPANAVAEVSCVSCHDAHSGASPHGGPEDSCTTCHEDKQGIRGSVHDPQTSEWAKNLGFTSKGLCLDCHPIHSPDDKGSIRELLPGGESSDSLCEACHAPDGPGPVVRTPHLDKTVADDAGKVRTMHHFSLGDVVRGTHPASATDGADRRIGCATCHDIHQKGEDTELLRGQRWDSGLCLTCHADLGPLLDTPHNLTKSSPEVRNIRDETAAASGPCSVCHLVHPTSADGGTWAQPLPPDSAHARGLCTGCHREGQCAERRIPEHLNHPEVPLLNRLSPEHPDYMPIFDKQGRPSPMGAISCLTCHQAHGASPSLPMFLRSTHQTLCADCHGLEAPWRFLYYHRADRVPDRRNPLGE